jgi:hypothetical protein
MTDNMIDPLDQLENGLEKVIPNLRKPNFEKSIAVYSAELQLFEDATQQVLLLTGIYDGAGIQLDHIGEFLDVPRQGQGDEVYRTALKTAIFQKTKHGGIEDLISVVKVNIPEALSVEVDEYYPATALIFVEVVDPSTITNGPLIAESIRQAKQAGVEIDTIAIESEAYFLFSTTTLTTPASRGFSSLSDPTGGILGGLVK